MERLTFDIAADELELFLNEVNEHLRSMEAGILQLEDSTDPETINAVFRSAHTIKALAGTVGHQRMAELTHTAETLFDGMREGEVIPTPEMIDALLAAVDVLAALRDEIVTQESSSVDVQMLTNRLRRFIDGKVAGTDDDETSQRPFVRSLTPEQAAEAEAFREQGYALLEVQVETESDAFAPLARLVQASMALMEIGEIVVQYPSMEELSGEAYTGRQLRLVLATDADAGQIKERVNDIADLAECRVQPHPPPDQEIPSGDVGIGRSLDTTVRISIDRLDTLMNLVGELVTDRIRLAQLEGTLRTEYGKEQHVVALEEMSSHFSRVVDQLQDEVMHARMLPISQLFDKVPRLVRDLARSAGKQIDLVIEGEQTELDRSVIEAIGDPLMHLVRNAVDHGIESPEERRAAGKAPTGTVRLTAASVEGQIVITLEDDGQGIDPERVRQAALEQGLLDEEGATQLDDEEVVDLIFRPRLSTAREVTEVSGRGVGMDVVRSNIEQLSGTVEVESELGVGTTFRVTLPLTLAIVDTMLVELGDVIYAIPLAGIIESLHLEDVTVNTVKGRPAIRWRDSVLPLLDLRAFFRDKPLLPAVQVDPASGVEGQAGRYTNGEKPAIISVAWGKVQVGLVVDRIIGKQELVAKSFNSIIGKVPGLSGCAILGDASISLIVDIPGLINTVSERL